jgi:hypothetical protein
MYRKYTKELLEPIVKKSISTAQVLKALGLKLTGGNYSHINKVIKKFNIDRSHFTGQGHNKGKPARNRKPTQYYLDNKGFIKSHALRNRLLKEGYFVARCQLCNQTEWMNKPIPLELHHIDCNPHNNNLTNLSLLCPNCHKYIHDNINKEQKTIQKPIKIQQRKTNHCPICKKQIHTRSKMCTQCYHLSTRKTERPSKDQLQKEIEQLGYCGTGRKYGVSDNAIKQWLK